MAEWFKPMLLVITSQCENLSTLYKIVDDDCEFESFTSLVFTDCYLVGGIEIKNVILK